MTAAGFTFRKIRSVHTLGEKLRRARKRKGVDLIEAELATKVRAKYLEALESEDFDILPNDIYVKGFIATYSQYLGLDGEKIQSLYNQQKAIKKDSSSNDFSENKFGKSKKIFVVTPKIVALFIGAIFCVGAIIYISAQVLSFASVPKLVIDSPTHDMVVETDSVKVSGKTDIGAIVAVNKEPITISSDGVFEREISLQTGINTIIVTATNKADKESSRVFVVERKTKTAENK